MLLVARTAGEALVDSGLRVRDPLLMQVDKSCEQDGQIRAKVKVVERVGNRMGKATPDKRRP